jgi:hypothetical protein
VEHRTDMQKDVLREDYGECNKDRVRSNGACCGIVLNKQQISSKMDRLVLRMIQAQLSHSIHVLTTQQTKQVLTNILEEVTNPQNVST